MWVALVVNDVLFNWGLRLAAVEWQERVSWVVKGVLFDSELIVVVVGCHVWVAFVVNNVLFNWELELVAVDRQMWVSWMVKGVLFDLELIVVVGE